MFSTRSVLSILLVCLGSLVTSNQTLADPGSGYLHLASHLASEPQKLQLPTQDWAWLRERRSLTLGVPGASALPLDVIYSNGDYEGISADVITLLKQQLGIEIKVLGFATRKDALAALQAGEIDLISRSSVYEHHHPETGLSIPYAVNAPSLYRRPGDSRPVPEGLRGMTIAVAKNYIPSDLLRSRYPEVRIITFNNNIQAMAAVAFQGIDGYIGDSLSAHYMINHSFFNYLKFSQFIKLDVGGYGFLLRGNDDRLMNIINSTLSSIGTLKMSYLVKRWTGGGTVMPEDRVDLSDQEKRWLAKHPVARLMINDDMAPSAYFDASGRFNGVVSDLFETITQRTGLGFEILRTSSFQGVQDALRENETDLALLTPSAERQEALRFSHPFATSSFSLVTSAERRDIYGLDSMTGKRLAIAKGHVLINSMRREYPDVILLEPANNLEAMSMVVRGEADAAVMALSMARYYTARLYEQKLRISAILDGEDATASFAMRRGDTELQSILDKAILSIPPDELNALTVRWRSNAAMSGQSWREYSRVIIEIVACALFMLTISMFRILQLRRQIRCRVAAEKALNDQLEFLQTLNDSMPIPIYVRDVEGRLLSCSRSYEQVMNLRQADVLGKTALDMPIEHFEVAPALHNSYLLAMETGNAVEQHYEINICGSNRNIEHWIQPFRDSTGSIKGVICGWQDVSEHRRLIRDLQQAKDHADEASLAKTQFLATMSHEIRTPMSAVIGTLELALKRADQGVLDRESIDVAYSSAKNLLELLGNTLDIVRIESGRLSFSPRRSSLKELVEPVARVFEGLARQKHLKLLLEIDAGTTRDVLVDPLRFKQILSNLVSNAIKFTDDGSVAIRVTTHVDSSRMLHVKLQVTDTGTGVSDENLQLLFRPFAQVAQSTLKAHGGSGLGLVVSRSLCEMMGGRLEMHSVLGHGTTVNVALKLKTLEPLPLADNEPVVKPQQALRKVAHVLIADDNTLNRQMLRAQLEFLGCTAVEAENGLEALQIWRQHTFDLLITDYHMSVMNGVELTLAIRKEELENQRPRLVVIGLTADAQQEEIDRCISAGMRDCLIKPASLGVLEERLNALISAVVPVPSNEVFLPAGIAFTDMPDGYAQTIEALRKISAGNPVVLEQLLGELLKSNQRDQEELRRVCQYMEITALLQLSHHIRGSAAIMRNNHLIELCNDIDLACAEGGIEALTVKTTEVDKELTRIEKAFARFS